MFTQLAAIRSRNYKGQKRGCLDAFSVVLLHRVVPTTSVTARPTLLVTLDLIVVCVNRFPRNGIVSDITANHAALVQQTW